MEVCCDLNRLPSRLTLANRHFAELVFAGNDPIDAYATAYPRASAASVRAHAHDLVNKPTVAAELARLRKTKLDIITAHQVNAAIADAQERQKILTETYRARLVDFLDKEGQPALTGDIPNVRAIREYAQRVTTAPDGTQTVSRRIRLSDPVAAIAEHNKMDGSYAPSKHLHGHRIRFQVVHTYPPPGQDSQSLPGDDDNQTADRLLSGDEPGNTT